ncbi:MAG: hypothetical protein ACLTDV_08020 [Eubacterium sp.]
MRKSIYLVPPEKRVRLFIDTDANCEADDQYAILHALMTQKAVVKGSDRGTLWSQDAGGNERAIRRL